MPTLERVYHERREAAAAEIAGLEGTMNRLSTLRIIAFLVAAGAFLLIETSPREIWGWLIGVGVVFTVAFGVLVRRHRRVRRRLERARLRARLAEEGVARLNRRWDELPIPVLGEAPAGHPSAVDLDLLGRGSLAHLVSRCGTGPGRAALRRALLDPLAPPLVDATGLVGGGATDGEGPTEAPDEGWHERVVRRQEAVERLAADPKLLEELELAGRSAGSATPPAGILAFLRWARGEDAAPERPLLLWVARGVALWNPVAFLAWWYGPLPGVLVPIGVIVAFLLLRVTAPVANPRYAAAEAAGGSPHPWAALLELADRLPEGSEHLDELRRAVTPADVEPTSQRAPEALEALGRITDLAAVRYSSLAHFFFVALFAWDVHVFARLERWRRRHGERVDGWVRAVAELELLASFAALRHDHPEWTMPGVAPETAGDPTVRGGGFGHPLLHPDECVGNEVELPEAGEVLIVTGSNMSGKSTLLRAIGTNQILALAGGPVAARSFRTRPILPWCSMRITDSLTSGVSYFLAELHRLKAVVEAARRGPVLYLLDEILQGTNTAERRTAARIVLGHLLATDAVGAVTTHDLTLVESGQLAEKGVNVHFREEVISEGSTRRLHFDHLLRDGPATSRNALLLLDIVGLGREEG